VNLYVVSIIGMEAFDHYFGLGFRSSLASRVPGFGA
jgi:hypothetical protein